MAIAVDYSLTVISVSPDSDCGRVGAGRGGGRGVVGGGGGGAGSGYH